MPIPIIPDDEEFKTGEVLGKGERAVVRTLLDKKGKKTTSCIKRQYFLSKEEIEKAQANPSKNIEYEVGLLEGMRVIERSPETETLFEDFPPKAQFILESKMPRYDGKSAQKFIDFLLEETPDDEKYVPTVSQKEHGLLIAAVRALNEFHKKGFIHGDFKGENIIVSAENGSITVHLIDLDNTRRKNERVFKIGTPELNPPQKEGESQEDYEKRLIDINEKRDVYALAFMFSEQLGISFPIFEYLIENYETVDLNVLLTKLENVTEEIAGLEGEPDEIFDKLDAIYARISDEMNLSIPQSPETVSPGTSPRTVDSTDRDSPSPLLLDFNDKRYRPGSPPPSLNTQTPRLK